MPLKLPFVRRKHLHAAQEIARHSQQSACDLRRSLDAERSKVTILRRGREEADGLLAQERRASKVAQAEAAVLIAKVARLEREAKKAADVIVYQEQAIAGLAADLHLCQAKNRSYLGKLGNAARKIARLTPGE